jgi:hypothetical protein
MKSKVGVLFLVMLCAVFCCAQSGSSQQSSAESALREAFVGRTVLLKLDMPGTQKGVDLNFGQSDPLEWRDYESRMKEFGAALHKGDQATVTSLVLKSDRIEFHLNGGGYGTLGDDTGSVTPHFVPKSNEQVRLEDALRNTTDRERRHELQDRIDREDSRRRYLQSQENSAAMVAQQMKQEQIANRRLQGGSRFNLRWKGGIPSQELSAAAVRARMMAYVDFDNTAAPQQQRTALPMPAANTNNDPLTALHRGMSLNELMNLLGSGQLVSQETNPNGSLSQEMLYQTETSRVHVMLVDSIVIRFTIESR